MSSVVYPGPSAGWWKVARAARPDLELDEAGFEGHLKGRAASEGSVADLYLAAACLAGERGALETFDRDYLAALPRQLSRRGVALAVAEETVQRFRVALMVGEDGARPRLHDYDGRGPLSAWVRVAAVRAASNVRRDEAQRAVLGRHVDPPTAAVDPELELVRRRHGPVFERAVHDAFLLLAPEERNAMRLTYTHGLNLEGVAKALGVSRATAGRRLLSCRERVREETLRLLKERIDASPAELESLLGVVRSRLELSLGALSSW